MGSGRGQYIRTGEQRKRSPRVRDLRTKRAGNKGSETQPSVIHLDYSHDADETRWVDRWLVPCTQADQEDQKFINIKEFSPQQLLETNT